jgi:hypothetical protein
MAIGISSPGHRLARRHDDQVSRCAHFNAQAAVVATKPEELFVF